MKRFKTIKFPIKNQKSKSTRGFAVGIVVENVSKQFSFKAVDQVSLKIDGSLVALLGPSGSRENPLCCV